MEEEINAGPEIKNTEKVNTKFGFLNWLGIAWTFYWRTYLLTVVLAMLFLIPLATIFTWMKMLDPSNAITLSVVFIILIWLLVCLACYLGAIIAVRWVVTLKSRIFALQVLNEQNKEVIPILEVKKRVWLKLGWSYLWRNIILVTLGTIVCFTIILIFKYALNLFQSNNSSAFTHSIGYCLQYIKYLVILSIMLLINALNVKWFLKAKHKNFKITLSENVLFKGRNPYNWLIAFLVFILVYSSFMIHSPYKKVMTDRINSVLLTKNKKEYSSIPRAFTRKQYVAQIIKLARSEQILSREYCGVLLKTFKEKKITDEDMQELKGKIYYLELNNRIMKNIQVPESMKEIVKIKEEYCEFTDKTIEVYEKIISPNGPTNKDKMEFGELTNRQQVLNSKLRKLYKKIKY